MNRPTSSASAPIDAATAPVAREAVDEQLSALVDGELDGDGATLWQADSHEVCASWSRYQLIGDVLRGASPAPADAARVAAIMHGVRQERAATVSLPLVGVNRTDAANDAVFRWKMVAGFASLAAVVAVAWNMAGSGDLGGTAGPQLAQAPVPAQVAVPVQAASPVVVAGEQGPVLRDPRLEELMAAHRQAGGLSALQMPAGFLRNAAFDPPEGQR